MLQELRAKYPQYNDMSDQQFADAFHDKYYADIPQSDYYKKIGFNSENNNQQNKNNYNSEKDLATGFGTGFSNSIISGLDAPNQALQYLAGGLNKLTGLDKIVGMPSGQSALPSIEEPENPSAAFNIGHGMGTLASLFTPMGEGGIADSLGGVVLKAASKGLKYTGDLFPKILSKFDANPQAVTDSIGDLISGGKTVEENAQSAAADLRNYYKNQKQPLQESFNNIEEQAGNGSIYRGDAVSNPRYYNFLNKNQDAVNKIMENTTLKDTSDDFWNNPNYKNANLFQSTLAKVDRSLSGQPGMDVANARNTIRNLRQAVIGDAEEYLRSKDPDLANQWAKTREDYRTKIIPLEADSQLEDIVKGNIKNPTTLQSIFKAPEDDLKQVMDNLGDNFKHKLLFDSLRGKINNSNKLSTALQALEDNRLSQYITPQIDSLRGVLEKSLSRSNTLKNIGKYGAASVIGGYGLHKLGL